MIWKKSSPFTRFIILLVALFSLGIFGTLFTVQNVSAFNYHDAFLRDISSLTFYFSDGTSRSGVLDNGGAVVSGASSDKVVTRIGLCSASNFPKNSLYFFTVYNTQYRPIDLNAGSNYYSVVSASYGEYGNTSFSVYADPVAQSDYSCFSFNTNFTLQTSQAVRFTRLDGVLLVDGATSQQVDVISNQLSTLIANDTTMINNQTAILQAIGGLNVGGIAGAINNTTDAVNDVKDSIDEQNAKDEQDRSNLENQQSSTESSADSAQASVESSSASIISNISSIMGALSTSPSNCNINVDTGNLQLTNINLCSVPTEIRSLINNVMVLIVTVSVFLCSYSLIRQFLNIYESFLAGGKS